MFLNFALHKKTNEVHVADKSDKQLFFFTLVLGPPQGYQRASDLRAFPPFSSALELEISQEPCTEI